MILPDFNDFPCKGRIMGIDWGARRIGIAVSDETRNFIFTRPVIVLHAYNQNVAEKIAYMAKQENVVGIIIGLPLYSDGAESDTAKKVKDFAQDLSCLIDLPIAFIDESYSSITAQKEFGKFRIEDIKQKLDSESARVILENAVALIQRCKR